MLQDFRPIGVVAIDQALVVGAEDFSSAIAPTFQDALKEGPEVVNAECVQHTHCVCKNVQRFMIHEMP